MGYVFLEKSQLTSEHHFGSTLSENNGMHHFSFLVEMGDIKKYSAHVQQHDLFVAEMTVQEHLMFAVIFPNMEIFSETIFLGTSTNAIGLG